MTRLRVGLTFEKTITVTESDTARHLAGKGIRVFATPEMVRPMEKYALRGAPVPPARPGFRWCEAGGAMHPGED